MKTVANYQKLNLPPCRLRVSERGGELCVWDTARGRWLVLTPEEWVRRHVLALLCDMGVSAVRIAQEHPIDVNDTRQRADVVVFALDGRPLMIIECKAPEVKVGEATLAQAFRYNAVLGARYLMLTNGLDHYIYEIAPDGQYIALSDFPKI